MAKKKQTERIVDYINQFGSITTYQAFVDLGCTRLASRIYDLKQSGYKINQEIMHSTNRFGEPVHFMKYSFEG